MFAFRDQHHQTSARKVTESQCGSTLHPKGGYQNPTAEQYEHDSNLAASSQNSDAVHVQYFDATGNIRQTAIYRYFTHRKLKYFWNYGSGTFERLQCMDDRIKCAYYHDSQRLSDRDVTERQAAYGSNVIAVRLKSIPELLFREILNPFYVFQIFSLTLWSVDEYWKYALCIGAVSLLSICTDIYQLDKNQRDLRKMIHSSDIVTVLRNGDEAAAETIDSANLVVGDIILVPSGGMVMQCDAVLLEGNCIVNESMLTGESVPVTKTPIPSSEGDLRYFSKEHGRHTLFCGTHVLQTRYYGGKNVRAVVIRTGFYTTKGALVRSIMYPKPVDFQFTKDLFKMIGMLTILAVAGFIYALVIMIERGVILKEVILRSLDIVTIVVPPALPFAMSVGIILARGRLKKRNIFCISPSTINTCGGINVVVFDKTGTLTEDGLDFQCAVGINTDSTPPRYRSEVTSMNSGGMENSFIEAMASCHSLTYINEELSGDPLDLILFRKTGWELLEPSSEESSHYDQIFPTIVKGQVNCRSVELGILKQFTFSSSLQRMTVIVRRVHEEGGSSSNFTIYTKGSPEKIATLCTSTSLPQSFNKVLTSYAENGYRVIALATKTLQLPYHKAIKVPRDQIESNLEFLGLVVLENRLKPETTPNIRQLNRANVRVVMATGDNIQTAISVARECDILASTTETYLIEWQRPAEKNSAEQGRFTMTAIGTSGTNSDQTSHDQQIKIDAGNLSELFVQLEKDNAHQLKAPYQLALTGDTYAALSDQHPSLVPQLIATAVVFARMSPDQKAKLISDLQELDYVVGMCGDGANDCGALKAAHAGISLSDAEASIASPFTSKIPNISCVPHVIKEGRAALVTSFGTFKYMANYSLCQFFSVSLLYWIATNLADYQFLYIDLFLITVLAAVFGYTDAADQLSPKSPPSRVLSVGTIASIFLQMIVTCTFQLFIFLFVPLQPWFVPFYPPPEVDDFYAYQVTYVFLVSAFQYITLVLVNSKGGPHRKTIFNNKLLLMLTVLTTGVTIWITVWPPAFLASFLNLMVSPDLKFRLFILLLSAANSVGCIVVEWYIVDFLLLDYMHRKQACGMKNECVNKKYYKILQELDRSPSWLAKVCRERFESIRL